MKFLYRAEDGQTAELEPPLGSLIPDRIYIPSSPDANAKAFYRVDPELHEKKEILKSNRVVQNELKVDPVVARAQKVVTKARELYLADENTSGRWDQASQATKDEYIARAREALGLGVHDMSLSEGVVDVPASSPVPDEYRVIAVSTRTHSGLEGALNAASTEGYEFMVMSGNFILMVRRASGRKR